MIESTLGALRVLFCGYNRRKQMTEIVKTFKFRLVPRGEQRKLLAQHAGASRWTWNNGLARLKELREKGEKYPGFYGLSSWFIPLRRAEETKWLGDLSCHAVRHALKRLDIASKTAFKNVKAKGAKAGFPRFHARGDDDSFTLPASNTFALGERAIRMAKIGWVTMRPNRGRKSCAVEGAPKMVVVKREGRRWFACVQCRIEVEIPVHNGGQIGIDMGVDKAFATNKGEIFDFDKREKGRLRRLESRRRRYQRAMNRKREVALRAAGWNGKSESRKAFEGVLTKRAKAEDKPRFSRRYGIARARAAKASRGIGRIRDNFTHRISRKWADCYSLIVVEDLKIQNMTASAKGDAENPGRNVRAKAGLNRAILARGWYQARAKATYKAQWKGGEVVAVAPHFTSQTCPVCACVDEKNRATQARFECVRCGHKNNADFNAAENILRKFLAQGVGASARGGGGVSRPVKRESPSKSVLSGLSEKALCPKNQGALSVEADTPPI